MIRRKVLWRDQLRCMLSRFDGIVPNGAENGISKLTLGKIRPTPLDFLGMDLKGLGGEHSHT